LRRILPFFEQAYGSNAWCCGAAAIDESISHTKMQAIEEDPPGVSANEIRDFL
jgi:hypothetical protein